MARETVHGKNIKSKQRHVNTVELIKLRILCKEFRREESVLDPVLENIKSALLSDLERNYPVRSHDVLSRVSCLHSRGTAERAKTG